MLTPLPRIVHQPDYRPVTEAYHADEASVVSERIAAARLQGAAAERVEARARRWTAEARQRTVPGGVDTLLREYGLSTEEGVLLMCLAEAVLRIPDAATADRLIQDRIAAGRWDRHLSRESPMLASASACGLWVSGQLIRLDDAPGTLRGLAARLGEPVIREAVRRAVRLLGWQFIMGRTLDEALTRVREGSTERDHRRWRYSFDMLGEAARSDAEARQYLARYRAALDGLARMGAGEGVSAHAAPGISVKLSALHPRFEPLKAERVEAELLPRLRELALRAAGIGCGLTVDAEEVERLDLTATCVDALLRDPELDGWDGLGIAVQAYQKRAVPMIDFWIHRARQTGRRLAIRLVKGAYWDTEIKRAQQLGFSEYPVFTRKPATDVSFLACARKLLAARDVIYPAFGTHNAHTVAAVLEMAGDTEGFELQRLHGMGGSLLDTVRDETGVEGRIYAPVGPHEDLLPYLVRRLLENGANSSFMHRLTDPRVTIEEMVLDPVRRIQERPGFPHPRIPLPCRLYGEERRNSDGVDLTDIDQMDLLARAVEDALQVSFRAAPIVSGDRIEQGTPRPVRAPATGETMGSCFDADPAVVDRAARAASRAQPAWDARSVAQRAAIIEAFADLLELHRGALVALCAREAGKTVSDAVAEIREAVDFARYYASRARTEMEAPLPLPGPTGEANALYLHGRGVFVSISPWNFPLAIATGQVTAALVTGNAALIKPAEQTPLTAARMVELLHEAGVPPDVLHFLPGPGEPVGDALVRHPDAGGVVFTGSGGVAQTIARRLAEREGRLVPFLAETSGVNTMVVDSSALPEQVVSDVMTSAFGNCGQRCSACRILCVQEEIADRIIGLLAGAMAEVRVGDPLDPATDVGPLIDESARADLEAHVRRMDREGRLIHCCHAPAGPGSWFAPRAYEIERIDQLDREVFGPVLHVVRYRREELDQVVDAINSLGYGLTFGVHSRLDSTIRRTVARVRAGNRYVNRTMVGSVVGSQPFGGEGRSGIGPHAGGPHYLHGFCLERVLTVNTAAIGANSGLLSLDDE